MIEDFVEIEFLDQEATVTIEQEIQYMKLNNGEKVVDLIEKGFDILFLFLNEVGCPFTQELIHQTFQKSKILTFLKICPIFVFFQDEKYTKDYFINTIKNQKILYINDIEGKYLKIFGIKEIYTKNSDLKGIFSKGVDFKFYENIFYQEESESSLSYSNEKVLILIEGGNILNEYHCKQRSEVPDLIRFILEPEKIELNYNKTLKNLSKMNGNQAIEATLSPVNSPRISSPISSPLKEKRQMENIFESPITISWFKLFLAYEEKIHFLLFLECLEAFKQKKEEEELKTSFHLIVENFLKKDSIMDLKFDEQKRKSFFRNFENLIYSQDMFDKMENEFMNGTIQFHYQRFKKSSLFQEMTTKFQ